MNINLNGDDKAPLLSDNYQYWCVVANVVEQRAYGPGGIEKRSGTKFFKAKAKVYIIDWFGGMCESVMVVSRHRKSLHFITAIMDVKALEHFRVRQVIHPMVIEHYKKSKRGILTKEQAENICNVLPSWAQR